VSSMRYKEPTESNNQPKHQPITMQTPGECKEFVCGWPVPRSINQGEIWVIEHPLLETFEVLNNVVEIMAGQSTHNPLRCASP